MSRARYSGGGSQSSPGSRQRGLADTFISPASAPSPFRRAKGLSVEVDFLPELGARGFGSARPFGA